MVVMRKKRRLSFWSFSYSTFWELFGLSFVNGRILAVPLRGMNSKNVTLAASCLGSSYRTSVCTALLLVVGGKQRNALRVVVFLEKEKRMLFV